MAKSTPLFVGLDVHKDSIAVAHAQSQSADPPVFVGAIGPRQGMSRRLLKLGGGSVTQFLTSSAFQQRVSETATAYAAPETTISSRPGVY